MVKYIELQRRAKALGRNHFHELFVAFAGGCVSLVLVFAGIRFVAAAGGRSARSYSTGDRPEQAGLTCLDLGIDGTTPSANEMERPLVDAG